MQCLIIYVPQLGIREVKTDDIIAIICDHGSSENASLALCLMLNFFHVKYLHAREISHLLPAQHCVTIYSEHLRGSARYESQLHLASPSQ